MMGVMLSTDLFAAVAAMLVSAYAVMGSPGPSTISVTAFGASYGVRRALPFTCGTVTATVCVLGLVAFGIVAVLNASPVAGQVLLFISIGYIAYLAYKISTAPPIALSARADAPTFVQGYLLGITNPKAFIAIAAVYSLHDLPVQSEQFAVALKLILLGFVIVSSHAAWLLLGRSLASLLVRPRINRAFNIALAGGMLFSIVGSIQI